MTDKHEQSAQDSLPLSPSSAQYGSQRSYGDCDDLTDDDLYSNVNDSTDLNAESIAETQSFTIRDTMLMASDPEESLTSEEEVDKRPDIEKVGVQLVWKAQVS